MQPHGEWQIKIHSPELILVKVSGAWNCECMEQFASVVRQEIEQSICIDKPWASLVCAKNWQLGTPSMREAMLQYDAWLSNHNLALEVFIQSNAIQEYQVSNPSVTFEQVFCNDYHTAADTLNQAGFSISEAELTDWLAL